METVLNYIKGSIPIVAILFVTACASSDIVKIGDTFKVFKEGGTPVLGQEYRLSRLKAEALKEAQEKCSENNASLVIQDEIETEMTIGVFARYELTFRCERLDNNN